MFLFRITTNRREFISANWVYYCQDTTILSHSDKVLYISSH